MCHLCRQAAGAPGVGCVGVDCCRLTPSADGKLRPPGIAAIEDRIVQAAVVMILTPVYESEFPGLSYGF